MAMRETEGSLRAYFLIAGTISALLAFRDIDAASKLGSLPASWALAIWFPIVARLVLGVGFIAAGIKLKSALPTGATRIKQLLLGAIAVLVVDAILIGAVLGSNFGREGLVSAVVSLGVTAYLLSSVRRLADEAMSRQPPVARVT